MFRSKSKRSLARVIVAACGVALVGGSARAGDEPAADTATQEATRHAAEMGKGKSHEDARAADRSTDDSAKATKKAKRHAAEMNKGKSHEDARASTRSTDDGEKATKKAKRHAAEMSKGKSHEDAKTAADKN